MNPWSPGANTHVTVHNGGIEPARGYVEVVLPEGAVLGATVGFALSPVRHLTKDATTTLKLAAE